MLQSSTGRRPTRSDSRPQIGMKRNCMTEKTAPGIVATKSPAPRRRASAGQKRDHQPEPEQVEEHRQEQRAERGGARGVGRGRGARWAGCGHRAGGRRRELGAGYARMVARRVRRHQAPVARCSAGLVN